MLSRFRLRALFLVLFLTLASVPAWHLSWAAPPREPYSGNIEQALNTGADFERNRKWLDAIELYEKASKAYPENPALEYGLRRSKIHFGIERRYSDKSFQNTLLHMSRGEAISLFEEILSTVQAEYVDPVSATSFVAHGLESFYTALADERFLQTNISLENRNAVTTFRKMLLDEYWNKPIGARDGARSTIYHLCDLAERDLRLRATPIVLEYIFGGCNALDDYSSYLTPTRLNDLYGNIEGQFVGLGIEMKAEAG